MIQFTKPFIGKEEIKAVNNCLDTGWVTTGEITKRVEKKIADYTGAKYCVLLNSCTAALHLSLEYLKQFKYGRSFTAYMPSLTFAATAEAVIYAGGKILWGDVDESMCLNPQSKFPADVAIPVHLCGVKAQTDAYKIAGVDVIEDSAHLIYKDQCKDSNHFFCYSFYATKNITMGEGGAICTNNEHAANWFRQARHHGISKDGWERYAGYKWEYDIKFIGWKYNPSDVLASILLANFDKIDKINKERQRCVDFYNDLLGLSNTGLHLYPIKVKDRARFMKLMEDKEIQCAVHFLPLHQMTAFRHIDCMSNNLKNTEKLGQQLVSLPLYPDLTDKEIKYICEEVLKTNLFIKGE